MKKKRFFNKTDRCGIEASGAGNAGAGSRPAGGDYGTDVIPLEEAVRGDAVGAGARAQAVAGNACIRGIHVTVGMVIGQISAGRSITKFSLIIPISNART